MTSESDIEIVHKNGDVTDKRDGVRRTYNEHVKHLAADVPPPKRRQAKPAPQKAPPRRRFYVALTAINVALSVGLAELIHHVH